MNGTLYILKHRNLELCSWLNLDSYEAKIEKSRQSPAVETRVQISATAGFFTFLYSRLITSKFIPFQREARCSQLWNCVFTGKLGAWITALSCENASSSSSSSSSSYSTRSVQPPQNSLETTTMQTFTAHYSQPGHFGLLLVNQAGIIYFILIIIAFDSRMICLCLLEQYHNSCHATLILLDMKLFWTL